MLDLGCGTGVDLVRFARGKARVVGVDLSDSAIRLARQNVAHHSFSAGLLVADGERLPFPDNHFDYVFAHGVVQYTANGRRLVDEVRRVLKPGGEAVFQGYNRISWLNALSKLMKVDLEHEGAPVLHKYSPEEFRRTVDGFSRRAARLRALPGQEPAARRLEGRRVQHVLRRRLQRAAAAAGSNATAGTCSRSAGSNGRMLAVHQGARLRQRLPLRRCPAIEAADLAAAARRLCDRHRGVGADGLIVYTPTPLGASMKLLNADGSPAELSGNGLRGLAAILMRARDAQGTTVNPVVEIETTAGVRLLTLERREGARYVFAAEMGAPADVHEETIDAGGRTPDGVDPVDGQPAVRRPRSAAGRRAVRAAGAGAGAPPALSRLARTSSSPSSSGPTACAFASGSAASVRPSRPAPDRAPRPSPRRRTAARSARRGHRARRLADRRVDSPTASC